MKRGSVIESRYQTAAHDPIPEDGVTRSDRSDARRGTYASISPTTTTAVIVSAVAAIRVT